MKSKANLKGQGQDRQESEKDLRRQEQDGPKSVSDPKELKSDGPKFEGACRVCFTCSAQDEVEVERPSRSDKG